MAYLEIPVDSSLESQRFELSLDGTLFRFRFYWNFRQDSWTMDIYTSDETALLVGIKIEPDWMPVFRYKIANFPLGQFIVVDTSGAGTPPARTEFGTGKRVKLLYLEASA